MCPHSLVNTWPYTQTLDNAGKACQVKTSAYYVHELNIELKVL